MESGMDEAQQFTAYVEAPQTALHLSHLRAPCTNSGRPEQMGVACGDSEDVLIHDLTLVTIQQHNTVVLEAISPLVISAHNHPEQCCPCC